MARLATASRCALPYRIWSPVFGLFHSAPTGIVLQVVTPFEAHASFASGNPIEAARIQDATGIHVVQVTQTAERDAAVSCT